MQYFSFLCKVIIEKEREEGWRRKNFDKKLYLRVGKGTIKSMSFVPSLQREMKGIL